MRGHHSPCLVSEIVTDECAGLHEIEEIAGEIEAGIDDQGGFQGGDAPTFPPQAPR